MCFYFQCMLLPQCSYESRNQNSIDNRITSSSQTESMPQHSNQRVQNNLVHHQRKHHRRPAAQHNSGPHATQFGGHRPESPSFLKDHTPDNPSPSNCTLDVREDKTFLWRIDTQPPSYFFGTIHVPYTRVWDALSENAKKAFKVNIIRMINCCFINFMIRKHPEQPILRNSQ